MIGRSLSKLPVDVRGERSNCFELIGRQLFVTSKVCRRASLNTKHEADELHKQKTTLGAVPVTYELETEATIPKWVTKTGQEKIRKLVPGLMSLDQNLVEPT